jgi:hypothetical protein
MHTLLTSARFKTQSATSCGCFFNGEAIIVNQKFARTLRTYMALRGLDKLYCVCGLLISQMMDTKALWFSSLRSSFARNFSPMREKEGVGGCAGRRQKAG